MIYTLNSDMMRKAFTFLLLLVVSTLAIAQENRITTFILVRHAEKDLTQSTNDPDLSAEGKNRAIKLVEVLKKTDIQAIYSTPYKRTQQTVQPLASVKGLLVMPYQANKMDEIDNMIKQHAGSTVLLSGHSNTVPVILNYLIGEEKYKILEDGDYGNIIVVSVTERGKNAKVVWTRY
jgi:2,3-bisphosphoglycerate-dependent phosphoglycerate mutase